MSRSRRLLTFRLDRDLRQRLKARLAGEGRTMSEVVILGLRLYVQHSARFSGPPLTSVVASAAELALPDHIARYLRDLRERRQSDLLSAALARLHGAGWPLRPLATALGISRQAVQARICQPVTAETRSHLPDLPPPSAFPRRRPALANGRRPHLTVKIDNALRAAAHRQAVREGSSLSQVIEKILHHYLRHGLPDGPVQPGGTTPARLAGRRTRRPPPGSPPAPPGA